MRMIKLAVLAAATAIALSGFSAEANSDKHPKQMIWSFDGMFGGFDRPSIQRGYQIYKQVCSSCHSMNQLYFRNLTEIGFSEGEVKTIAKEYTVKDGPNDNGEMFDRPASPSDKFPSPHANEKAARAANNGAYPPDLSLIVKARHDGANYVYSLLTGYETPPAEVKMNAGMHYNPYFPGGQIAMPAPLSEGLVQYQDGTTASLDQMAHDVVNFLQWAAEPEMEQRKRMGIKVLIFLGIMTAFFAIAKRRVWSEVK